MPTLTVSAAAPDNPYPIHIGPGLLQSPDVFAALKGRKAAIITDENVGPLYAQTLIRTLENAGAHPSLLTLPAGESVKSALFLQDVIDFLLSGKLTRTDAVIALGGGVIGDLTGLAACLTLRGIPLWQLPTTLLAQVDSSVGGKVAVNHEKGKNLIGAFYQPEAVIIDTDTLATLPARQIGAGLGEVVKYGCIWDEKFFAMLERAGSRDALVPLYPEIIERCVAIKAEVVHEDPLDRGLRMILNYGHTLAHALENVMGYGTLLHGEAVSIGMTRAAAWGEHLGITMPGTKDRLLALQKALQLPFAVPAGLSPEALASAMALDKKTDGDRIRVILLDEIGRCRPVPMRAAELSALLMEV